MQVSLVVDRPLCEMPDEEEVIEVTEDDIFLARGMDDDIDDIQECILTESPYGVPYLHQIVRL